ncbi:MAG: MYG1 family protein [Simkania sp.]|nr:MYG1 family protein [Simkania sp.]
MNLATTSRSFGTHDGSFHADEVTACALLLLFDQIDRDKIIRTRDADKLDRCEYVCDVGGIYNPTLKRFDHHQSDYQGSLSGAGMVWEYLKAQGIIEEPTYQYFNHSLLIGVDAIDNGRDFPLLGHCSFSQVVSNFVPAAYDVGPEVMEKAFQEALDFVLGHLKRLLERFSYIRSCREKVVQRMALDGAALIFDEAMPWMDSFFDLGGEEHPALFVIMPSGEHWKLRGIPPNNEQKMLVRMPLPEEWAGLINDELKRISGISGAIFCHKGRFISVWETKKDALEALDYTLNKGKKF